MEQCILGRTNLKVSILSLGMAEFGTRYGIRKPREPECPAPGEAARLLHYAAEQGINLFDTAPTYGESEELLGKTLGKELDCYFATKVSIPAEGGRVLSGKSLKKAIDSSLKASLKALNRDYLDIVQVHNATPEVLYRGEITEIMLRAKDAGIIRFLGASVYGKEAAQAVVKAGAFDILQAAYNLLDQRMVEEVLPAARQANIGVICRSALLKGALTDRAQLLPNQLEALRRQATKAVTTLAGSWEELPGMALRFCLSSSYIDTVLIGVCNRTELNSALEAAMTGPLENDQLELANSLALSEERLINPTYWLIP